MSGERDLVILSEAKDLSINLRDPSLVSQIGLDCAHFPPPRVTPIMQGTAYYDLFSAGRATWTDRHDIGGRGADRGCRGNRGNNDDDDDDEDNGD